MPPKKGFLSRAPFPVTFVQEVAAGSLLTTICLFANPAGAAGAGGGEIYEVIEAEAVFDVVSTSGTADLRNVPAATAMTGGTSLIATGTINLGAGARAVAKTGLTTNRVTRMIQPGSYLSLILAGTLTNLVGAQITVWLQAMRGVRNRS